MLLQVVLSSLLLLCQCINMIYKYISVTESEVKCLQLYNTYIMTLTLLCREK